MSDAKLTAEESCRQVLKSIADACDQESLARAGGYLFRYVQEETVLRDCGQRGVCRTPPGCARHWEERNRELARENEVLHSNSDHLSSENASLSSQVESMAMRIESLAEELAKPEDVRLREALDALEGRAVIFDGLGARVGHLLDEMDEWIGRAGEAERMVEAARRSLSSVAEAMTEHAYEPPPAGPPGWRAGYAVGTAAALAVVWRAATVPAPERGRTRKETGCASRQDSCGGRAAGGES